MSLIFLYEIVIRYLNVRKTMASRAEGRKGTRLLNPM